MIRNSKRVFTTLVLAAFLSFSLLTGCGTKTTNTDATKTGTTVPSATSTSSISATDWKTKPKISMKFMARDATSNPKEYKDLTIRKWIKEVEEKYNVTLDYQEVDKNTYDDKFNVMWAAGELPDLVRIKEQSHFREGAANKVFIPVTDLVKNNDPWKGIDSMYFDPITYKGEIYSFPGDQTIPVSLVYRVDWAKKLNIKTPTNANELYEMVKAFSKNDPDGNGKADTYGIGMIGQNKRGAFDPGEPTIEGVWRLFLPVHHPGDYYLDKDGKVQDSTFLVDDMKAALGYVKKLYDEKILDPEWVVDANKVTEEKFLNGKIGIWPKAASLLSSRVSKIKAKFPEAEIAPIPTMQGKYGASYAIGQPGLEHTMLTKTCKDPERGKRILEFYNNLEGVRLRILGIEGESYKIENNDLNFLKPVVKENAATGQLLTWTFNTKIPNNDDTLKTALNNIKGYASIRMFRTEEAISPTFKERGTDLDKIKSEYFTKVIIGEGSLNDYDKFLEAYKKAGAEKVLKEISDEYSKNK